MCHSYSYSNKHHRIKYSCYYHNMDESANSALSLDSLLSSFTSPPSVSTASLSSGDCREETPNNRRRRAYPQKRVRFSTTEIREYRLIPDAHGIWDQPYQLTLAWDPISISTMTVKAFRKQVCAKRRFRLQWNSRPQVLTPYQRREKLVQSAKAYAKARNKTRDDAPRNKSVPQRKSSMYARILKRASNPFTSERFDTAAQMPLGWDTNDCVHSVNLSC